MKKTGQCVIPLIIGLLGGCQTFDDEKVVFEKYYQTTLGYSTSADVLEALHNPLDEYLSQGDRVAATWNEADDGQTHWFNMVAFDEEAHHRLARRAAAESAVLLKNDGPLLPLRKNLRLAVIGDLAVNPRYQGNGSSLVNPTRLDNALDEIKYTVGGEGTVIFAQGYAAEKEAFLQIPAAEPEPFLFQEGRENNNRIQVPAGQPSLLPQIQGISNIQRLQPLQAGRHTR